MQGIYMMPFYIVYSEKITFQNVSRIWDFQSSEFEDGCLLGCSAM
jgi:hypothetical protein